MRPAGSRSVLAVNIDNRMPSPPFPDPDEPVLEFIIANSLAKLKSGEIDARAAITHAAVHGWFEGHKEGEDDCPGCTFR
jgi:hypothetical protein